MSENHLMILSHHSRLLLHRHHLQRLSLLSKKLNKSHHLPLKPLHQLLRVHHHQELLNRLQRHQVSQPLLQLIQQLQELMQPLRLLPTRQKLSKIDSRQRLQLGKQRKKRPPLKPPHWRRQIKSP